MQKLAVANFPRHFDTSSLRPRLLEARYVYGIEAHSALMAQSLLQIECFKVGVHGSRMRREVVMFVFAIVRNRPQSSATVRNIRNRSLSFASVRGAFAERRTCVGFAGATKIVAKRRTVVTFYVSVNRQSLDREAQNCRHFWREERREER